MHVICVITRLIFYMFQVAEESASIIASDAGAEITERAIPGQTVSPSNSQPTSMAVPSTSMTDNASTLASLRIVSYTDGFQLCVHPLSFSN